MNKAIVIMGVAGCGKSSLGAALAERIGAHLIEGDDFHSATSRAKMSQGIPLTDTDRQGWLEMLGKMLQNAPKNTVLTCSALKQVYRDKLRAGNPRLRFIYLRISPTEALQRVTARAADHFFPGNLVDSQFATLECPSAESDVLTLNATQPLTELTNQVIDWLKHEEQK